MKSVWDVPATTSAIKASASGAKVGIVGTGTQDGLGVKPHRFKKRRKECFTGFQSLFVGFQSTVRAHGEVEVAHHPSPGMCGRRLAVDIPFGM